MTNKQLPVKLIAINSLLIVFMLGAIELLSSLILANDKKENKLRNKVESIDTWRFELHPGVGHSHIADDFKENPNAVNSVSNNLLYTEKHYNRELRQNPVRFLVLGGSTTDPLGTQFSGYLGTWPDHFAQRLKRNSTSFAIVNAGAGASTSSQELLRLVTILEEKKFDHVISLNGINEIYFSDEKPFHNPENIMASKMVLNGIRSGYLMAGGNLYGDSVLKSIGNAIEQSSTYKLFKILTQRNSSNSARQKDLTKEQSSIHSVVLSKKQRRSLERASRIWFNNVRLMHSASSELGSAEYKVFLQPTYGIGVSLPQLMSARQDSPSQSGLSIAHRTDPSYLAKINYLYLKLREKCEKIAYCIDLSTSKKLTSDQSLYTDPRHLNNQGNALLAGLILSKLNIN